MVHFHSFMINLTNVFTDALLQVRGTDKIVEIRVRRATERGEGRLEGVGERVALREEAGIVLDEQLDELGFRSHVAAIGQHDCAGARKDSPELPGRVARTENGC